MISCGVLCGMSIGALYLGVVLGGFVFIGWTIDRKRPGSYQERKP